MRTYKVVVGDVSMPNGGVVTVVADDAEFQHSNGGLELVDADGTTIAFFPVNQWKYVTSEPQP